MDVRTASAVYAAIASNPTTEPVVWEPLWNDALIARSRSLLASKFMESPDLADADVMVMIDDDIVFEPQDFWKLVEGARATRGIYAGAYVTRSDRPHLASRTLPGTRLEFRQTPDRRPIEIQYAATGFVAVHRDVFTALLAGEFRDADGTHRIHRTVRGGNAPFWPFFATFSIEEEPGVYHYLSEDWALCERARQLGVKVWLDQSIILAHMGWYPFTVGDLNAAPGLPSTGTDQVTIGGRDRTTGEPLLDTLIDDIAEFSDDEPGMIRRMADAGDGTTIAARLWNERGDQTEEDWYRRNDVGLAYILDLAAWHIQNPYSLPREALPLIAAGDRVLDHGCGIGTFALLAAAAGARVTAYDINPILTEFVQARADRHGLEIEVWTEGAQVPRVRHYDAVVTWHVLEHVDDPKSLLMQLLLQLKDGGLLIADWDFHVDDGHPQHHTFNAHEWDDFLAMVGLKRLHGRVFRYERAAVPA